jgi:salicylate hydroxylase
LNNLHNHIAIIGSGIAGLTLGCALKSFGIDAVIFERSKDISEYGAGISISRNGLKIIKQLNILDKLKLNSYKPELVSWNYRNKEFHTDTNDVFTMSRKKLIKVLYDKYTSLGGKIFFEHELQNISADKKTLTFKNNDSYSIKHIAACDGIKSIIRDSYFLKNIDIKYSGFNAWRGIGKSENKNIEFHLGPRSHVVKYPVNKNLDQSFVAIIKSKNWSEESWKIEGSIENCLEDLSDYSDPIKSIFIENQKVFKWGIFVRPPLHKVYVKNITLFGDAAHSMVPFMGQGGCMAIEDAYTFALLIEKLNMSFSKAQIIYNKIRVSRNNKIQKISMQQSKLNHIGNPIIASIRNTIMKRTNIIASRTKFIWSYDVCDAVEYELKKI